MSDLPLVRAAAELVDAPSDQTISTVLEAARHLGTLYVADHGLTRSTYDVMQLTRSFFALSHDERMTIAAHGAQDSGYRGADRTSQVLSITRTGDQSHPLFGPIQWPQAPRGFQPTVESYLDEMYALCLKILATLARGFGLSAGYFESLFGKGAIENLQLRCYDATPPHNPMPLGAHSDPPPITLIAQDEVGGLETLVDGQWVPVAPRGDALVCQFGAMMARFTDDEFRANVHRVRSAENTVRFSIVYNLLPRPDAVIERLPTHRSKIESRHAAPMRIDDFLRGHLAYDERPARSTDALDAATFEGCRVLVERSSQGRWSLKGASRTAEGARLSFMVEDQLVELDVARREPSRRYYKTVGEVGISYRGEIHDQAIIVVLDRMIPGLAALLADRKS